MLIKKWILSITFWGQNGLTLKETMKTKTQEQRVKEIVDYIQNYDGYQRLFEEIERDIRKFIERERKKNKGQSQI